MTCLSERYHRPVNAGNAAPAWPASIVRQPGACGTSSKDWLGIRCVVDFVLAAARAPRESRLYIPRPPVILLRCHAHGNMQAEHGKSAVCFLHLFGCYDLGLFDGFGCYLLRLNGWDTFSRPLRMAEVGEDSDEADPGTISNCNKTVDPFRRRVE